MTDSVKIIQPPHDPITPALSAADDRITLSNWLPPQQGIVPVIRVGKRETIGKAHLTTDQISANPRVKLIPPPK